MVYLPPENFDIQALDANRARPVEILYNGSGIHKITGPVPLIDITKSANRNSAGAIESYTTKIDINGKIVRTGIDGDVLPGGSGIGPVLSGINALKNFFDEAGDFGVLQVICGVSNVIYEATGVRILDLSFNQSDDNWIFTSDFNLSMEHYESSKANNNHFVQNTNDSWTIEPVEDYTYSYFVSQKLTQKQETHNPFLLPNPATSDSPQPQTFAGTSENVSNDDSLSFVNIPQYRISRRVSAVGLPSGTGNAAAHSAYFNAKKWVEERLSTAFDSQVIGSGFANFNYNLTNNTRNIDLYNHLRNINFSVSDGSYEVNDTWLAMPTGIPYIEDYSIESSTDDRFIKTVRVQGQIKGLSISPIAAMSGDPLYNVPDNSGRIALSGSLLSRAGAITNYQNLDKTINSNNFTSNNQDINSEKYNNALNGWLKDIKPYLYKRASFALNSSDRNRDYVNKQNPREPVGNPIYSYEPLLNPNPVSTTEGLDPRKGTISYSVEFTNKLTLISGVIAENISISDTGPSDVFGESFIIGRRLGPILQSLNAKTSTRKDVSIEVTVLPPSSINGMLIQKADCPLYTGGSIYQQIETIIEAFRPFGEQTSEFFGNMRNDTRTRQPGQVFVTSDNHNWSPAEGRYSRSVSWTYQQCDNSKSYLDH